MYVVVARRIIKTHGVVSNAPGGDANAVADVETRVHRLQVVARSGTSNVKLSDSALRSGGAESLHGVHDVVRTGPTGAVLEVL